ncbi:hypothetical protein EYC80_001733 [Monilinia laxa]|nr:hypothetical protein EYC80_001733 [Monilinia laxa]
MDKQHAELVKSGMKDGDPVKAEAAAEKSIEEAAEEQSKIADQFAILAWAKLNGVTSEQIFDHMSESGKEFNSDDFSSLINKGARENRDHEKIESAKTAASTMGWSLTEWCQRLHGVNTPEEYLEKLGKIKEPEYMLTENAAQSKRLFREKLLCDAYGPGETSKGEFHSWDDVVLSMPFTEDWDALVGSGKNVEPTEYTLVPRMLQVNQFDGKELWVGVL